MLMEFLLNRSTAGFNNGMHVDKPQKFPSKTQDLLKIERCSRSGVFGLSDKGFSALYSFSDINYKGESDESNAVTLLHLAKVYNALSPDDFKVIIENKPQSASELQKGYLFQPSAIAEGLPDEDIQLAEEYDRLILQRSETGRRGLKQEHYLLVRTRRNGMEAAEAHFVEVDNQLRRDFSLIGSQLKQLTAEQRVDMLHDFFRPGENWHFHYDAARKEKRNFLNDIAPTAIKPGEKELYIDGKFYRFLYVKKWPVSGIEDRFIGELTGLPYRMIVTIDCAPIRTEDTNKRLESMYMAIEQSIYKEKQNAAKNGVVAGDNYYKQTQSDKIRSTMDSMAETGEKMFFTGLTVGLVADSMDELNEMTETVISTASGYEIGLEISALTQIEAMLTALPIGFRQTGRMRTLLSQRVAALMPFYSLNADDFKGLYYGQNTVSKRGIFLDRHLYGHGFTFGSTGSGKSFINKFVDQQMALREPDTLFYFIDPQREKNEFVQRNRGTYVEFGVTSKLRMNPLEASADDLSSYDRRLEFVARKINFVTALVQMTMVDQPVDIIYRNLINRCVTALYESWTDFSRQPQLEDLYKVILSQPEEEAKGLALVMESLIAGPLSIFNCQSSVDMTGRVMGFGFRELSDDLMGASLLIVMEYLSHQLMVNHEAGKFTYVSVEEFRYIANYPIAAKYFENWFSMVRKFSGMIMCATQNIASVVKNKTMETMVNNAPFTMLLRQQQADIDLFSQVTGVEVEKLQPLLTAPTGTGLIRMGKSILPFENIVETDSVFYKMYNTDDNAKKKALEERKM